VDAAASAGNEATAESGQLGLEEQKQGAAPGDEFEWEARSRRVIERYRSSPSLGFDQEG
jgi:hypothetical protein